MIDVRESGNIFSAFASFSLAELTLFMTLKNIDTGKIVAIERSEMLDRDSNQVEYDMLSHLQIQSLDSGKYELQVIVPKGHWTYTRNYETCLSFTLVMEYWKRKGNQGDSQKIIGVYPPSRDSLALDEVLEIHLSLSSGT